MSLFRNAFAAGKENMPVSKLITKGSLLITLLIGVTGFAVSASYQRHGRLNALSEMGDIRKRLQSHLLKEEHLKQFQNAAKMYLEKEYHEEFLLDEPTVRTDFLGCWYAVTARLRSRPEVVFGLRGNYNSYSKKELPADVIPKSFDESFRQALWKAKSNDLKTRMDELFVNNAVPVYEQIIASNSSFLELDYFKMKTHQSTSIATSGVFTELCVLVPDAESVGTSKNRVLELLGQHFREWPSDLSYAVILYCCPKFAERMRFRAVEYQYNRYDKNHRNPKKNEYTYAILKDAVKKLKDDGNIYFAELYSFNPAGMPMGSVASTTIIE